MQNNIAIIGSDSFLAQYLIQNLSPDHTIVGYSRNNNSQLSQHVPFDYPGTNVDFEKLLAFDAIIYCAGSGIQAGRSDDFVYELNTFLPLNLALYLNEHSYSGKLITFGSYAEIGNNLDEKAFTEAELLTSLLAAPNNYCVSKRLLSRFFHSASLKIKYFHLILPTIYGSGENPNRLIPYLVNCLRSDQKPKLTSGHQTRQYIHTKDAAALLREVLMSQNAPSGIYNVPCYETRLVKDIVAEIYEAMHVEQLEKPDGLQRYDESMKFLKLDSTKIQAQFPGWKPEISILNSIKDYYQ
jgi:nucleoside-diphosphate-sugar epimerase